jgi:two-component system, OmpR family, sensor histidine kinase KdpD
MRRGGKNLQSADEGIRRRSRVEDTVIGVVESHGRKSIGELASNLETVPRRTIQYRGASFEDMDMEAILARKPQVVLVR